MLCSYANIFVDRLNIILRYLILVNETLYQRIKCLTIGVIISEKALITLQ